MSESDKSPSTIDAVGKMKKMTKYGQVGLLTAFLLLAGGLLRADTVNYLKSDDKGNTQEASATGTITGTSRTEVVIRDRGGIETPIPANEVLSVQVDAEPVAMPVIRTAIETSQYEDALAQLGAITAQDRSAAPPLIRQEIDYLRAWTAAQLALSGNKEYPVKKAGGDLYRFIQENPESFRFFEANRLVGRLLAADGNIENAKKTYQSLAEAPWPEMKFEGKVALGNLFLDEKNVEEAKKVFEEVAAAEPSTPAIAQQRFFARIGLGRVAALGGDAAGAKAIFDSVIEESNAENALLQATLYNAIGQTALEAGNDREALLAYLHVDLLFSAARMEHIKALKNLVILWKKDLKEDRSAEAAALLRERYGIAP